MEWCGKICSEENARRRIRYAADTLMAMLLFCLILTAAADRGSFFPIVSETVSERAGHDSADAISDYTENAGFSGYRWNGLYAYAAESGGRNPAVLFVSAAAGTPPVLSASVPKHRDGSSERKTEAVKSSFETNPAVSFPAADPMKAPEISADSTAGLPGYTAPEYSVHTDESMEKPEEIPADPPAYIPSDPVTKVVEGFLVDESGTICGIAEPGTAVRNGRMLLPSEGCTAIAGGAFLNAPGGIREIHIPANITEIAEGAFSGLNETEWFSAEEGGNYVSVDGVLFSDGGTCLFAFPAARIGIYRVPAGVVRFAADAFTGASVSKLDTRGCSLEDTGNLPEEIEIIKAPQNTDSGIIY